MRDIELIADQIAQDLELQTLQNELEETSNETPQEDPKEQDEINLYF